MDWQKDGTTGTEHTPQVAGPWILGCGLELKKETRGFRDCRTFFVLATTNPLVVLLDALSIS